MTNYGNKELRTNFLGRILHYNFFFKEKLSEKYV